MQVKQDQTFRGEKWTAFRPVLNPKFQKSNDLNFFCGKIGCVFPFLNPRKYKSTKSKHFWGKMDSISPCFESQIPKIESSQNVFAEKLGSISPKKYRKSIHVNFFENWAGFSPVLVQKGRPPKKKILRQGEPVLEVFPPALPPSHSHPRHRPFGPLVSAKDGGG